MVGYLKEEYINEDLKVWCVWYFDKILFNSDNVKILSDFYH